MDLLIVAYYLSILSFYLGTLIYSLPIPIPGLKKWGPRLIVDGVFTASLSLLLSAIVGFATYIKQLLGADWNAFMMLLRLDMGLRAVLVLDLDIVSLFINIYLPTLSKTISSFANLLLISLYTMIIIYIIAVFVYRNLWTLLSLGVALMAIPFRIARSAGAYLVAFALVFYTALPLYYHFIESVFSPYQVEPSIPLVELRLVNMDDKPIDSGYIGIESRTKPYIGPLPISNSYALVNLNHYSTNETITIYLDVCAHKFYTNITNITVGNLYRYCRTSVGICVIPVKVLGIAEYRNGLAVHIYPKPRYIDVHIVPYHAVLIDIGTDTETELYVSIVDSYTVNNVYIDGQSINNPDSYIRYDWYWYDVHGRTYVFNLGEGNHSVKIDIEYDMYSQSEPGFLYVYKALDTLLERSSSFLDMFREILITIYVGIIGPILYLSLLSSISIGLARLLGGSSRLRFIP